MDNLQLLLAGVAGDVEMPGITVNHIAAFAEQFVDDGADAVFVAGDGGSGNDNAVAVAHFHLLVGGKGHAVQG